MRKVMFLAGALSLLPLQAIAAGDGKLSAHELRGLAPGAYQVAVMALVSLSVKLYPNGLITGQTGANHDQGRWHIVGDRLCITWSKWLGGQMRCSALSNQNGALVGDGLTIKRI